MGIYDREYYREPERGLFLGGNRSVVTNLILVNLAIFLADVLVFDHKLSEGMALEADLGSHPWKAWELLTHGFAHDPSSLFHVGFNMFALWLFGRDVEIIYGRKQFLQLYLSLIVMAGLCWLLSQRLVFHNSMSRAIGASGAVTGIMVVYVLHYPTRRFYVYGVLPVPVFVLAGIYLLQDFFAYQQSIKNPGRLNNIANEAHLGGAAFGFLFYRTQWTLFSWLPTAWLSRKTVRSAPPLRVHMPEADDERLGEIVDQILEKISREGEASLTKEERRTLEDASRRYQKRRN